MTDPMPDLRNDAIHFLQKHSDLTYSAVVYVVDKLCGNGFYITRTPTPAPNAGVMKVKPGEIERAVWSAMIWAADNSAGFNDAPEYTDRGNSFAEDEARRATTRILAAIETTPDPRDAVIARMVEAAEALGAMPEGYCFCRAHRIGDDSKVHEAECADLRAALAAAKEVME